MPPTPPFWVLQRQVKVEPLNEESLRLSAPNLPPFELRIKPAENGWVSLLHRLPAGEGEKTLLAESDAALPSPDTAWDAAFELYRQYVVV